MKTALVSGGSGEIGAAICARLARSGWRVLIHAHQQVERAQSLASEISANGGSAHAVAFDVTDAAATSAALGTLLEQGAIQGVVHNAGIHDDAPMAGMSAKQWHGVIDVSLHGFYNVVQPLLLPMIRTRWGRIVSVTSIAGILGNRGQTNYAAAKAGLHGATRALALEVASRGVTVNAVAPGVIATAASASVFDAERIARLVPMNRPGTPDEVAALVAFLVTEEAGYITGQVISINGGMT
ncbi:MAG: 3-oxoacyl-ACP reductase FabG [Burkholderiales bacterium]